MAEQPVTRPWYPSKMTPERWAAGERYIAALNDLGFKPETTLWIFDEKAIEFQLALITDIVDRVGSLDMHQALFRAFENAATPADFDPWVVALFSPNTFFANEFAVMMSMNIKAHGSDGAAVQGEVALGIGDYTVRREWIYTIKRPTVRQSRFAQREWADFKANVDRIAA